MEGNLKILMITDTSSSVWRYVMSLCKALEPYKVEIHLVNLGDNLSEEQKMQMEDVSCLHLYNCSSKFGRRDVFESDFNIVKNEFDSLYNEIAPDIVHNNTDYRITYNLECPVISVFNFNSDNNLENSKDQESFDNYLDMDEEIKSSNVIIAPSYSSLEHVKTKIPIEVVYGGLDGVSDYSLEKEYIVLSAGGFWDNGKSIMLLSAIAKKIEWPLCIAEESKKIAEQQRAKQYENVFILERLPQAKLQHYMDRSSIFIMPSKYEKFGLTVLIAAKSSCALILPDTSFYREIWGDSALYFTSYDEEQAYFICQLLISDERLRNEMAKSAFERSRKFTAERMAGEYFNLYETLHKSYSHKQFI